MPMSITASRPTSWLWPRASAAASRSALASRPRRRREGHGVRHSRLDLWRQPAGDGGGHGGAGCDARTRSSFDQVARRASGCGTRLEQFIGNYPDTVRGDARQGADAGHQDEGPRAARDFVAHLRDNHGLLTVAAGDNVLRVLPPLVIERQPDRRVHRTSCRAGARELSAPPARLTDGAAFPRPVGCGRRRDRRDDRRCDRPQGGARWLAQGRSPMPMRRWRAMCWR